MSRSVWWVRNAMTVSTQADGSADGTGSARPTHKKNMPSKGKMFLLTFVAILGTVSTADPTYKVCVTAKDKDLCKGLKRGDSPLDCDEVSDYADCALRISAGYADFGVMTGEAAAVAAPFEEHSLRAIHQLRHVDRLTEDYAFHSVVIVRNSYVGNLSGAKFCHPGYSDSRAWTDRVLKKVERSSIVGTSRKCYPNKSAVENEVSSAASYFGPSCRPGEWSSDEAQDRKLKKNYHSLCDLCDNPWKCSYNNQAFGSHVAALHCLKNRGDVAYVALEYVKEFFGLDGKNNSNKANASDFSFWCENLSRRSLTDSNPCPWVSEPWPVIVANVNKSNELAEKLTVWLKEAQNRASDNWRDYLSRILLKSHSVAKKLPKPQSIKEYVGLQLMAPSEDPCKRTVRWCAATDLEHHKCSWLARAVETHDFSPRLDCVRPAKPGTWGCLAAVRDGIADIVGSDSSYAEIARGNFSLRPLLYQETENDQAYKVLAAVRTNSSITKIGDLLKQKTAVCFNEYGTIAMSAWLDLEQSRLRRCPSNLDIIKVFPKVCAPGADDENHNPGLKAAESLCVQCSSRQDLVPHGVNAHTCVANESNLYYGDMGALRCLQDRRADVAFIDLRGVPNENRTSLEYRVLCRNGSVSTQPGLNVDFDCSLSEGIGGEILTHRNVSIQSADALFLLKSMQLWFDEGLGRFGDNVVLNMFAEGWGAERTKGVLFRPSTLGFVDLHDTSSPQVNAFAVLQERRKHCIPNSAHRHMGIFTTYMKAAFAIFVALLAGRR